jgi:antagonist of KipI
LATVQDLGRDGWRSAGVPQGGAVDRRSHCAANWLLGNSEGAASIEWAGGGALEARVLRGGWVAHMGRGSRLWVSGGVQPSGRPCWVETGGTLALRPDPTGQYGYLAVRGGWDVPVVLGSRSTCLAAGFGGLAGRMLAPGDRLQAAAARDLADFSPATNRWFVPEEAGVADDAPIRVFPGPEADWWAAADRAVFAEVAFRISAQRSRMGLRLLPLAAWGVAAPQRQLLSTAVLPGTVQLPPDGQPIVLLADAQTTGGYPRIAQVAAADLDRLAQAPVNQTLRFQWVAFQEAAQMQHLRQRGLRRLRCALRLHGAYPP